MPSSDGFEEYIDIVYVNKIENGLAHIGASKAVRFLMGSTRHTCNAYIEENKPLT